MESKSLMAGLAANGFAVARNCIPSSLLNELQRESDECLADWKPGSPDPDYWSYWEGDICVLYRIHNLEKKRPLFKNLLQAPALLSLVSSIVPQPCAPAACALIYKAPGLGAEVPWHRDPLDVPPGNAFNFSVFLDHSGSDNGRLEFLRGSHLNDAPYAGVPVGREGIDCNAGDVLIHDVRVYHGSSKTIGAQRRRSIIIEFRPIHCGPFQSIAE